MVVEAPEFVLALASANATALARIDDSTRDGAPPEAVTVRQLLRMALKNELEASELAARWMGDETDIDVKLAFARQCGDEAKHYRLIAERLNALGDDLSDFDPLADGYSPLFQYLATLQGTVPRLAAGPYTRESLAVVRNDAFIEFCEAQGDVETARLYREIVQPDERHHRQLGERLLSRLATDGEQQAAARIACAKVLALAEEAQEMARMKAGLCRLPGC